MTAMSIVFCVSWDCVKTKKNPSSNCKYFKNKKYILSHLFKQRLEWHLLYLHTHICGSENKFEGHITQKQ